MRLLNIHGYKGSPENSAKKALVACGYDVVSFAIDYDASSPTHIYDMLAYRVCDEHIDAVVGTSFGGFFALLLSAQREIPALLINPAIVPGMYLPELGYKRDFDIRELHKLSCRLKDIDMRLISTIVGEDDEVIDSVDYTEALLHNSRFIKVPGGKHSGDTLGLESILSSRGKEFFEDRLKYYFV